MATVPETATALVFPGVGQPLTLETSPTPPSQTPGAALVRVLATGIRPHNRAGFAGKSFLSFPVPYTAGNSGIARVLSVGDDSVSLQPGQLVYVDGFLKARDDQGTTALLGLHDAGLPKARKLFQAWKGLWRDVASVPLENCIPLNEDTLVKEMGYSIGDLAYIERLAVANGGVYAAALRAGETVIVAPATGHYSGATAELAAELGCRVIALTRSASKLGPLATRHSRITPVELTGDVTKDTQALYSLCPGGSDAFIDVSPPQATASPHHFTVGLAALRTGGRAVLLGAMGDVSIPYASLMGRNINLKGQHMYTREGLLTVVKLIETGVVKLGPQAGHEIVEGGFAFQDWERAVEVGEKSTFWGQQVLFMP